MRSAVVAVASCWIAGGCDDPGGASASAPPPVASGPMPAAIALLEPRLGPFTGLALAPEGVFLDRHRVGALGEVETSAVVREELEAGLTWLRARALPRRRIDIPPDRAATSLVILPGVSTATITRAFEILGASPWDRVNVRTITDGMLVPLCALEWREQRPGPKREHDSVILTVELSPGQTTIGLSRINEFEHALDVGGAPDFAWIARRLAHEKTSAFFADRTDLQLAADPRVPAPALLSVLAIACRTFPGTVLVDPRSLAARAGQ